MEAADPRIRRRFIFNFSMRGTIMPRESFVDFPVCATIKELITDGAARGGDKRQFVFRDEAGEEREKTFRDVWTDVCDFGAFLREKGLRKGDMLAILCENCYFWNVVYYAAEINGLTVIPLDTGLAAENVWEQLSVSGCGAVFYSEKQAEKAAYAAAKPGSPLKFLFPAKDADAFLQAGREAPAACREAFLNETVEPEDLAAIVFTSGTTGRTKGVMLTHKNVCSNVYALLGTMPSGHGIGFLPLNHTYAWVSGLFATLVKGEWGYICTNLRHIYKDIQTYKPKQFAAVPLVVEMIYQNIIHTAKRNGTYDKLMQGIKTSKNFMLSGYDARREIFSDIHEKLGGELECIFCGGAYLSPEIEEFMYDVGIQIITGYGLTECAPVVTCSRRYEFRFGSQGLPLTCCEVRIHDPDEDGVGEIYVRGDNVMRGYYNDPEATAAAFDGEWLKTGDCGYLDKDGFLFFTGRKKNLIILSNGKNVSPEEIEGKLTAGIEGVKEVLVYEKDKRITAEFYLDEEAHPELRETLASQVEAVCETLPEYMHVQKILIRDTEFDKTSTLKIKR